MSVHVGNKITSVQPKPKSPYKLNQELNEIRKLESERQSAFSGIQCYYRILPTIIPPNISPFACIKKNHTK